MTLATTYFGANGWLLEFDDLRVLVDPWLQGSLSFPPGGWMLKGELPEQRPAPDHLDLLLLTQGLADHAHPESLDLLPRTLPVIGSVAATQVVKKMGFETVQALKPGECTTTRGYGSRNRWRSRANGGKRISARACIGKPLPGTPRLFGSRPTSPTPRCRDHTHGGFGLPALGAFVKGCSVVPQLVERFQPSTVLASTSGGDVRFSGALTGLLQMQGSVASTGATLPDSSQWIDPTPGERLVLKG
jgi:hypothetical protein